MPQHRDRRTRTASRVLAAVLGTALVWASVVVAGAAGAELTVVLLLVLLEVVAVAVLAGPFLAVVVALAAVVLVNFYAVEPYGTFRISDPVEVVELTVFGVFAACAAILVEVGGRARATATSAQERTELLTDVVAPARPPSAADALQRIAAGLDLDRVELRPAGEARAVAAYGDVVDPETDPASRPEPVPVVDLALAGGYRLVGFGPPRIAADPAFVAALGAAAVRAYDSERLAEERRRSEELAAIDQARTALLASVGHDLRTPLAGVRLAVDALRDSPGLSDGERAELLDTAAAGARRLDDLITNLLDLSRLEAGAVLARPESVPLYGVVDAALGGLADGPVDVRVPEDLPPVRCDPVLLERVVHNLVANAVAHAPPGCPPVVVVAASRDDAVTLDVVDRGPGIPEQDRERVFTPFQRVGDAQPGAGLGLAIVRGFCAAMGVGVELTDTPGGGLTARLRIPVGGPA